MLKDDKVFKFEVMERRQNRTITNVTKNLTAVEQRQVSVQQLLDEDALTLLEDALDLLKDNKALDAAEPGKLLGSCNV